MEEKTNDYIRVGNTYSWLFVLALVLVILAGSVWGSVGSIPITDTVYGYLYVDETRTMVICTMDASRYSGARLTGNDAVIRLVDGTQVQTDVTRSTDLPIERENFTNIFSTLEIPDWMMPELLNGEYMYILTFEVDPSFAEYGGELVEVSIVTDHKKPFELL